MGLVLEAISQEFFFTKNKMRALQFFTPEEFALEKEWLQIRDMLLGDNYTKQNVEQALQRATHCQHKHAQYLTRIFQGKMVTTKEEARQVFLSQPPKDAIALCFSECVALNVWDFNFTRIKRSADLGFVYALRFDDSNRENGEKEIAQRERSGFLFKANCLYSTNKKALARVFYEIAAELGSVEARIDIGVKFDRDDPTVWIWFGKTFLGRNYHSYISYSLFYVESIRLQRQIGNRACIFQIGHILKQRTNLVKRTVCGAKLIIDSNFDDALFAIEFYNAQLLACRKAVDTWSCVALRNRVCKDIRILIAKYIWRTREEALY